MTMDLIKLFFVARMALYRSWIENCYRYYLKNSRFFFADMMCCCRYFFCSPYRMLRKHDEQYATSFGPYGETSFHAMESILDQFHIGPSARIAEVGSGRGRLSLWLRLVRGHHHVVAIEAFVPFTRHLQRVCRWLSIDGVQCMALSWQDANFDSVDVVYVYSSSFSDVLAKQFADQAATWPAGTTIISVSFWLDTYCPGKFLRQQEIETPFIWGTASVYKQIVLP